MSAPSRHKKKQRTAIPQPAVAEEQLHEQKKSFFRPWYFGAALPLLALLIYWPVLDGPFVLDDYDLRESFSTVVRANRRVILNSGRPLLMLTFIANHRLAGGFDASQFHLTNVLLHGLNALLLWLFARALFRDGRLDRWIDPGWRPLFIYGLPLLFLTTPVQSEAVAYISARSELMAAAFFIGGLGLFASRLREERPWLAAVCVLVCVIGAAASKQDKITLPVALFLMDWLLLSQGDWKGLRRSWPTYGLFVIGMAAGFFVLIRPFLFAVSAGFNLDWKTYLFTQFRMYFRYLRQFTFPFGLNLDPEIAPSSSLTDHFSWLAAAALVALVVALLWFRRKIPLVTFGGLFFLLVLAPTTSFFPLLDFAAERRLYLPSVGFFLAALCGVAMLARPGARYVYGSLAAILIVYSIGTLQRAVIWSDELLLWGDVAAKSPNKGRPWSWLGRTLSNRGRTEEAEGAWRRSAALLEEGSNEHAYVLNNLGLVRAQNKDYAGAIAYYEQALAVVPGDTRIRAQLAVAQIRAGDAVAGWRSFHEAFRRPALVHAETLVLRAQEFFQLAQYQNAVNDYFRASQMRPEDLEIQRDLEIAREHLSREPEAPR